jgi:cell wall-associated NlpC family hydrolase
VGRPGDGSSGSRAVNFAAEKLGSMYLWGGDGSAACNGRVDCSGLTHWAYSRLGIEIGRDTYSQIGHGVQIAPSAIRPGDLIFCNFGEGGIPGPGHVVMATGYGADSRVIEASQTGAPVLFGTMPGGHIVVKRMVP